MKHLVAFTIMVVGFFAIEAIAIDMVPIGNPGNAFDTHSAFSPYGSVDFPFHIGRTEVTNAEYAEFLTAVAAGPNLALYDIGMDNSEYGGITRTSVSGLPVYSLKPGMANKPVNFVSWYDAIRFANWLHNGKGGPGTTEYGAYTLLGGTIIPSNANSISRTPGAHWALTSEDEWYKAAYYNPTTASYYVYPTASDAPPAPGPPPGGVNSANLYDVSNISSPSILTDVGAYAYSPSPYGTFDQAGNLQEWNESLISLTMRGTRGGAFTDTNVIPNSGVRGSLNPGVGYSAVGFRVVHITVPEPSTFLLVAVVAIAVLFARRRHPSSDELLLCPQFC